MNEGLATAEQAGAAGTDAANGGQVGMMEDGQLHRETAPHAGNDKHYKASHKWLLNHVTAATRIKDNSS